MYNVELFSCTLGWHWHRLEVAFALFWFGSTKWATKKVLRWQNWSRNATFDNGMIEMFDFVLVESSGCAKWHEHQKFRAAGAAMLSLTSMVWSPNVTSIESETDWRYGQQNQGNGSIDCCRRKSPARRQSRRNYKDCRKIFDNLRISLMLIQDEPLLASRSVRTLDEQFIVVSACQHELCRWCRFEGPSRQDVSRTGTTTETTETIEHLDLEPIEPTLGCS